MKPLIDQSATVVEVKDEAEEKFTRDLDHVLEETVFSAGCSNWYINSAGRNSAAWPGLASTFWRATYFPKWGDFTLEGGSISWPLRKLWRQLAASSPIMLVVCLGVIIEATRQSYFPGLQYAKGILQQVSAGG